MTNKKCTMSSNHRYEEAKNIFKERKFFKMICGAGNDNPDEVYKLVYIYTLAGAKGIDLSANPEIVSIAKKAISDASHFCEEKKQCLGIMPFITVSVGMKGDPHIRKAMIINKKCKQCKQCISICPQNAISSDITIDSLKCIGCGRCKNICRFNAIDYYSNTKSIKQILIKCKKAGAEHAELHASIPDDELTLNEWRLINNIFSDNFVSLCIDRSNLSNIHLSKLIKSVYGISKNRLIIQADGIPMSGGIDDFNSTLQAIATADIINKALTFKPIILVSGGTNSKTMKLAQMCNVEINGVSIGSFARQLVNDGLKNFQDEKSRKNSIKKAKKLVKICIGDII